jgi:hypothetical protein
MTLLTHPGDSLERVAYGPGRRVAPASGGAQAHLAVIKRFCIGALAVLAAGGAVAAIMALKIVAYLPLFMHH